MFLTRSGAIQPFKPRDEHNSTHGYVRLYIVAPHQPLMPLTRRRGIKDRSCNVSRYLNTQELWVVMSLPNLEVSKY
jgi:hypothetical protein